MTVRLGVVVLYIVRHQVGSPVVLFLSVECFNLICLEIAIFANVWHVASVNHC